MLDSLLYEIARYYVTLAWKELGWRTWITTPAPPPLDVVTRGILLEYRVAARDVSIEVGYDMDSSFPKAVPIEVAEIFDFW